MKKIIFFLLIAISVSVTAEGMWVPTGQLSPAVTNNVKALAASQEGDLYASVWADGVYKSTNKGVSWTFSGLSGKRVSCLAVAPDGDIYGLSITQNFAYIHRSTNKGITWTDVYTGSYPLNYAGGGAVVFPDDGSIVAAFAVTVGPTLGDVSTFVFKSTNGGNDWFRTQVIDAGFVGGMTIISDGRIFLGTSLAGVVYSSNNGNTFSGLGTFPSIYIKTILTASQNTIYVSDAYGLNRSTDNGLTFTDVGSQSSGVFLQAACLNSAEDLFISLDNREVFYSNNRGDNWTQIIEGLPPGSNVNCFVLCGNKMFCGTSNSGVFIYENLTGVNLNSGSANNFELNQNYPNPFNPSTSISYILPSVKQVTLKIYDAMGRGASVLVNEKQNAGEHSAEWDASDFSSGIYFYQISLDGVNIETKKMQLIK